MLIDFIHRRDSWEDLDPKVDPVEVEAVAAAAEEEAADLGETMLGTTPGVVEEEILEVAASVEIIIGEEVTDKSKERFPARSVFFVHVYSTKYQTLCKRFFLTFSQSSAYLIVK